MSNSFNDLFEKLLEDGSVDVAISGPSAEILRTSLSRKWNTYKKQMSALGFLPEEKEKLVLGVARIEIHDVAGMRYMLKERAKKATYEILPTKDGDT